jgi:hypothetical protein
MALRIKILSLLCALLALQAIGASAAQAVPEYTASEYPSTATSENPPGSKTFTTEAGTVECTSHGQSSQSGPTSTVTIASAYTNCKAFGFLNATVNTEGCTYVSHATERIGAGAYRHHIDINCQGPNTIKIIAGTCEVFIPAQSGLTTVQTTNLAEGKVTIQPNITNITYGVLRDGFLCPFAGIGYRLGSYHGDGVSSRVGGGAILVSGE